MAPQVRGRRAVAVEFCQLSVNTVTSHCDDTAAAAAGHGRRRSAPGVMMRDVERTPEVRNSGLPVNVGLRHRGTGEA
jgi:hypothetical protein